MSTKLRSVNRMTPLVRRQHRLIDTDKRRAELPFRKVTKMRAGRCYRRPLDPRDECSRPWVTRTLEDRAGRAVVVDVYDEHRHKAEILKMLSSAPDAHLEARYLRPASVVRREVPNLVGGLGEKALSALVATVHLADGGKAYGLAELTHSGRIRGCEVAILVSKEVQESGIARELLRAADQRARDLGQQIIEAAVPTENATMLRALDSEGFRRTSVSEDGVEIGFEKRLSAETYRGPRAHAETQSSEG